jgi:hypothetical protein
MQSDALMMVMIEWFCAGRSFWLFGLRRDDIHRVMLHRLFSIASKGRVQPFSASLIPPFHLDLISHSQLHVASPVVAVC